MANDPWSDFPAVSTPSGGPVYGPAPDRSKQEAEERARAAEARAQEKAARDAMEWKATHNADGSPKPKPETSQLSAAAKSELKDKRTTLTQYENSVKYLKDNFDSLFGTPYNPLEYIPTPAKRTYYDEGQRLLPLVAKALGFTSKQMDTPAEIKRLEKYVPSWGDTDEQMQRKISVLENMLKEQKANVNSQLDGPTGGGAATGKGKRLRYNPATGELE